MIKALFISLLITLVLLAGGLVAVALMVVEDEPLVPATHHLSTDDLQQAREFLANADPRKLSPGDISAVTVGEMDLQLLLNYLLQNLEGGSSRVDIAEGQVNMDLSIRLPENLLGPYLNVRFSLAQWADVLVLESLHLGTLQVPAGLADAVMKYAHQELKRRVPEYVAALDAVNGYSINTNRINVVYQWQPELLEQISNRGRDLLISEEYRGRLAAHARNLAEITRDPALPVRASLTALTGPMFQFALQRQGDPVEENRAAIAAMSMYIMGINVTKVLGDAVDVIPATGRHRITLSGRQDFAQHFLVSAGLATSAGTSIADSIGLLKEMEDSQSGGSGFSFTDIGADRAGVRFAQLAVAGPEQARAVQQMLAGSSDESIFMPDFSDLPEFMKEEAFQTEVGGVGSAAYERILAEIESRIDRLPLFSGSE